MNNEEAVLTGYAMLWSMNKDKLEFIDHLQQAVRYFIEKYSIEPNFCRVSVDTYKSLSSNPDASQKTLLTVAGIPIEPDQYLLSRDLHIGVREVVRQN